MATGILSGRNRVDFCDENNAGADPQCGSHPYASYASGWSCINASYPNVYAHGWYGDYTPDAFREVDDRAGAFPVEIVEVNP